MVAAIAVVMLLTGGGGDYEITADFENASQVVGGEQVVIGGQSVGQVSGVELGPRGEALVTFSVNDDYAPLREGTVATIRTFSLSGVANRQIQLTIPPDQEAGEEIESGSTLPRSETVAAVDLDQLFNTLDEETVEDFKHVIQGFERSYEGVGQQANRGLRYMNPFLSQARRLFHELTVDQGSLEQLLVQADRFSGALAERSDDITQLVGNLNLMMNAIGDRSESLAHAIREFPDFMRRSNTTFVNLRATLDDVTPLVQASIPAMRALRPFLPELRGLATDAAPTFRGLSQLIRRPGSDNDLLELTRRQIAVRDIAIGSGFPDCGEFAERAKTEEADPALLNVVADDDYTQGAFGEAICSLSNGHPQLEFFRAYTGELLGWMDTFSHSGFVDAMGGVGRVQTSFNTFTFTDAVPSAPDLSFDQILELLRLSDLPLPLPPGAPAVLQDPAAALNYPLTERCPNAQAHAYTDPASVPFTDGGHLTDGSLGHCDPEHLHDRAGP